MIPAFPLPPPFLISIKSPRRPPPDAFYLFDHGVLRLRQEVRLQLVLHVTRKGQRQPVLDILAPNRITSKRKSAVGLRLQPEAGQQPSRRIGELLSGGLHSSMASDRGSGYQRGLRPKRAPRQPVQLLATY
jgi:hypothetical protein